MKKRILTLILAALIAFSVFVAVPVGAKTGPSDGVLKECTELWGRDLVKKMDNAEALLYLYDAMDQASRELKGVVPVYSLGYRITEEELLNVYWLFKFDHAEYFWISNFLYRSTKDQKTYINTIEPGYKMDIEKIPAAREVYEKAAMDFLGGIDPSMNDLEKELYIHDKMVELISYDYEAYIDHNTKEHTFDAYGAVVERLTVCDGYARAFQGLLHMVGIPCLYVSGKAEGSDEEHAWNCVKINGKWYQTDVTWDDPGNHPQGTGENMVHRYFNLTDAKMAESHTLCEAPFPRPVCDSTEASCENVKQVNLGKRTAIWALDGFTSLESVDIPDSVTQIGRNAFYGCSALESVVIGENVETIGDNAFYRCGGLTEITIPDSVTQIGVYPFYGCSSLERVEIGSGLKTIGRTLFSGAYKIKSVIVGDGVETISEFAFFDCTSIEDIVIGKGVEKIGYYAFFHCPGLTAVTIPDSVKKIEKYAFYMCENLRSVSFGISVKDIEEGAFAGCPSFESIYYAGSDAEWSSVSIENNNPDFISSAKIFFNHPAHRFFRSAARQANCVENGIASDCLRCSLCGQFFTDETGKSVIPESEIVIPALGHDFGEWETQSAADCENKGYETRVCSRCDHKETRVIPAFGHDWGDWEVLTAASDSEPGLKRRICLRDPDHVETKIIPMLTADPGDANGDGAINAKDVIILLRLLTGWEEEINFAAADLNGDGKVNTRDVIALMRMMIA